MCNGGVTLGWVEDNLAGPRPHQEIQGYTLDTQSEFTVLETADLNAIGSIAVDKGFLYYGSLGDTIITREQSDFSGYVLSGDAADPRAPFAYCRCSQALSCVQQGYAGRGCGAHGVQISTGQQRRIDSVGC